MHWQQAHVAPACRQPAQDRSCTCGMLHDKGAVMPSANSSPAPGALPRAPRVDVQRVERHGEGGQAAVCRLILQQGRQVLTRLLSWACRAAACTCLVRLLLCMPRGMSWHARQQSQPQACMMMPCGSAWQLSKAHAACAAAQLVIPKPCTSPNQQSHLRAELLNELEEAIHGACSQRLGKHLLACTHGMRWAARAAAAVMSDACNTTTHVSTS